MSDLFSPYVMVGIVAGGGGFPILSPRNVSSVQTYVQNLIRFRRK